MSRTYAVSKRIFDVAAAAGGLLLIWPLLAVFYVLARRSSGGSGSYMQERAGKGGKTFRMCKFRTMRADHVHDPDPAIVVTPEHEAVTPIGRFLRRHKLDELPQLLNVLKGEMSLVGPRPTVPEQVVEYDDFQRRRLGARPGITGLAQINGDTALTWEERIEWDVYYVDHRTFWMDLKILLATPAALVRPAGERVRRLAEAHPGAAEGTQPE